MKTKVCFLSAVFTMTAFVTVSVHAAELTAAIKSMTADGPALPHCVNDPAELEAIDIHRKQNSKNEFKYTKIREVLASDSDEVLVARLAYAETLAANCPEHQRVVLYPIVSVIQNRIAKRKGDVKSVVFQRDQFASSLNGYEGSKWREFLCPTELALWQKAHRAARAHLPNGGSMITNIAPDAFNYYLYQHSSKFSPPDWAKKESLTFSNSKQVEGCLKIFKGTFK